MAWVAVGIAGGTALVKGVTGAIQNGKANAIDRANQFPNMPVQNEYVQNMNQAQNMAQTGLPQAQYNNTLNAINRNQSSGLAAYNNGGRNGSLASIIRAGDDATGNLNAQDAMARNRNLLLLLQERRQLAGQKDKAWDWNYQQRYLGNLAKSNALRGSANANINGAFNDGTGLATTLIENGGFGNKNTNSNPLRNTGVNDNYMTGRYNNMV